MKKLVIVAGSPNTGKTITVNMVIQKLTDRGYTVDFTSDGPFWAKIRKTGATRGGVAVLKKDESRIAAISFGDDVEGIQWAFGQICTKNVDAVVCCSHATKGKSVFRHFHDYIGTINLNKVKILPIYKNLISDHGRDEQENEQLSDIITDWVM